MKCISHQMFFSMIRIMSSFRAARFIQSIKSLHVYEAAVPHPEFHFPSTVRMNMVVSGLSVRVLPTSKGSLRSRLAKTAHCVSGCKAIESAILRLQNPTHGFTSMSSVHSGIVAAGNTKYGCYFM